MLKCYVFVLLVYLIQNVVANTEKVIFRAPPENTCYTSNLPILAVPETSRVGRLEYTLATPFLVNDTAGATDQWFLLTSLGVGWTYEVRLCWPAIMPTEFLLDVFSGPDYEQITGSILGRTKGQGLTSPQMFLRVRASPDFVSHKKNVMQSTPVVKFELVLDPLLFRAIPRSLLGTTILIILTILLGIKVVSPRVLSVVEGQVKERRQKVVRIKTQ